MNEKTEKLLDIVGPPLEKKFGKGTVMSLSSGIVRGIPVVQTGIPQLDIALGIGGLPKGRIVEIYGPESSGKTTLALKIISQVQAEGGSVGYVDIENSLDPVWAEKNGVDIDSFLLSQPDSGEDALDVVGTLIDGGADIVVVDSVSALVPKAELEGDFGASHVGLQARLMGQALRKLTGKVKKTNCILLFINQIRYKIGVMFGSPETTSGGNALKFYASLRIDIRRISSNKDKSDKDNILGNNVRIKVVKNKCAPPFKVCTAMLDFKMGFDTLGNLFDLLVDKGFIKKGGAWYSINGTQLGQGREASIQEFEKMYGDDDEFSKLYFDCIEDNLNKNKKKKKRKRNVKGSE